MSPGYEYGRTITRLQRARQTVEAERVQHMKRQREREAAEAKLERRRQATTDDRVPAGDEYMRQYLEAKAWGEAHNPTTLDEAEEKLLAATEEIFGTGVEGAKARRHPHKAAQPTEKKHRGKAIPLEIRERVLERLIAGERGTDLANEYGITKAAVSQWKKKMKKEAA